MKKLTLPVLSIIAGLNLSGQTEQIVPDSTLNQMYQHATGKYMRGDTLVQTYRSYYVVVNVTNQNTDQTKEICVSYPFLEGAINIDSAAVVQEDKRIFKFYAEQALRNKNLGRTFTTDIDIYGEKAQDQTNAEVEIFGSVN